MPQPYCGRFAPSPTGPLHFGSLIAAVGSRLDALAHGGRWMVRMEDVDAPRNVPGAAEDILRTLEGFGFEWDGAVLWQSQRHAAYAEALSRLRATGDVYPCTCSRREIADSATRPAIDGGLVYPGTCRDNRPDAGRTPAWRLRVAATGVSFEDRLQGRVAQSLAQDVGDFVLLRADGQYAYQLAVVVDDADQGITDVVRGADLLASTPRQIWLQQRLGVPTPRYAHLPVAANAAGEKLSKQTLAKAVQVAEAPAALTRALAFLGQDPPPDLARAPLDAVWHWARAHWRFAAIPRTRFIPLDD